jgi:hypothetical protein
MQFSYRMVPEVYQLIWAAMARGEFITDAAVEAGTYRKQGTRWLVPAGSVYANPLKRNAGHSDVHGGVQHPAARSRFRWCQHVRQLSGARTSPRAGFFRDDIDATDRDELSSDQSVAFCRRNAACPFRAV